jgi:long-chain acyl-CoA synthetase
VNGSDNSSANGFWAQAAADPGRIVLVAPDGEEWTAARLRAACDRLTHGLRAAGLRPGDAVAVVLPNGVEFFTAHLAAFQAGFYLVPVNPPLVGPEIAWIVGDSGAKEIEKRRVGKKGTEKCRRWVARAR